MLAAAVAKFGTVDIVVNNAGATKRGEFESLTDDDFIDGFAPFFREPGQNLRGGLDKAFHAAQHASRAQAALEEFVGAVRPELRARVLHPLTEGLGGVVDDPLPAAAEFRHQR